VIYVAVGQEEEADFVAPFNEPVGGLLGGVDENAGFGQEEAVCLEHAAGKAVYDHRKRLNRPILRSQWISGQWMVRFCSHADHPFRKNPLDEAGDDIDTHFSA